MNRLPEYHIREMQRDDLAEVTALESACFSMPWKYRDFEEVLANPDRCYLIAEADNGILGGCMLTHIAGEGDISNVAVHEKYRGSGIASALLSALIQLGETQYGIKAFTLEVRSRNMPARRLYEHHGFVSAGVRPHFYEKPKDDAVIMWRVREET